MSRYLGVRPGMSYLDLDVACREGLAAWMDEHLRSYSEIEARQWPRTTTDGKPCSAKSLEDGLAKTTNGAAVLLLFVMVARWADATLGGLLGHRVGQVQPPGGLGFGK